MAELLEWLARRLVDEPDAVRVETEEREDAIVFHLHVAPDDVGKVIGRQGRIARALRSIVRAGRRARRRALRARDCRLTRGTSSFASGASGARTVSTARSSSSWRARTRGGSRSARSSSSTASRPVSSSPARSGGGRRAIKLDRPVERGAELAVRRDDAPARCRPTRTTSPTSSGWRCSTRTVGASASFATCCPGPANDVLELDTGLLLPLVEDCIREVDLRERRILLNPGFTG